MLRAVDSLMGHALNARDGEVGKVTDLYFDSEQWVSRYLVVQTGSWLMSRRVLLARTLLGEPDWEKKEIHVNASRQEIEEAPRVEEHKPVSVQEKEKYASSVGWGEYWDPGVGGIGPPAIAVRPDSEGEEGERAEDLDTHLRSYKEVKGYRIHATDGDIGHVEDFVVNTGDWTLRYMIVDTRNWLPGRKVLVSPQWVSGVSWRHSEVQVDLTKESIKHSPEFDPLAPVNRDYENHLHDYYGRPKYWEQESGP